MMNVREKSDRRPLQVYMTERTRRSLEQIANKWGGISLSDAVIQLIVREDEKSEGDR